MPQADRNSRRSERSEKFLRQSRKQPKNTEKEHLMKINPKILVFAAAAALLAGCATNDHSNSGASGNDSETGIDSAQSSPASPSSPNSPAPAPNSPTGAN